MHACATAAGWGSVVGLPEHVVVDLVFTGEEECRLKGGT